MRTLAKSTLRVFWKDEPQAELPLSTWYDIVSHAEWKSFADVKGDFRSADYVGDNRIVFNVSGNKYRVVAHVSFPYGRVLIKFVGTHKQYDRIDARTV